VLLLLLIKLRNLLLLLGVCLHVHGKSCLLVHHLHLHRVDELSSSWVLLIVLLPSILIVCLLLVITSLVVQFVITVCVVTLIIIIAMTLAHEVLAQLGLEIAASSVSRVVSSSSVRLIVRHVLIVAVCLWVSPLIGITL
jgi:hypothetical protein